MATKNETLLLSGGITYEEKNKNTKEELDVKAKDIEVTVNNIARVERIIKNLPDFSDTSIDIKPFYDELIDIELKNLKQQSKIKGRESIVEARRKNIERLKNERKNAIAEQTNLHHLAILMNNPRQTISKINNKRRSNYVDFGKTKEDTIHIPIGKTLKQVKLEEYFKERNKARKRADLFYGKDEEFYKKYMPSKQAITQNLIPNTVIEENVLDIANVEKTFFQMEHLRICLLLKKSIVTLEQN